MWLSIGLIYLSTWITIFTHATELATPHINITEYLSLPKCVQSCGARVLAAYNCLPTDPCFCQTTGPQVEAVAFCLEQECTLAGSLASMKFQADACKFPARDKGQTIATTSYVLFGVATLFVVARLLSRLRVLRGAGFGIDDGLLTFCYLPTVGMTVVAYFEMYYGSGRDSWTVPLENFEPFAMWFYIGQPMYVVVTFCTKLSLVFLYLRIWGGEDTARSPFRITCVIVATSLTMCTIGCVLAGIFPCRPISYAWRQVFSGESGECTNRIAETFAVAGINIAYDVIVLLLPIPRFIGMRMSLKKKIGICSCFLVGFATTAISIIRLTTVFSLSNSTNPTWDYAGAGLWSLIEVYCCMICCCMPAFAGFLHRSSGYMKREQWSDKIRNSFYFNSRSTDSKILDSELRSTMKSPDSEVSDLIMKLDELENGKLVRVHETMPLPMEWDDEEIVQRPRPIKLAKFPSEVNVNVLEPVERVPPVPKRKTRSEREEMRRYSSRR